MYDFLKPFIYYVYSLTYNIKFVRGHILLMEKISFSYSNERNEFNHIFDISFWGIDSIREFYKNVLKYYDEELVNEGHFLIGSIHSLTIHIGTFYYGNDDDDYVQIARELVADLFLPYRTLLTRRFEVNHDNGEEQESEEEEEREEEQVINAAQTFKSNECVICLSNPPKVLFCNCGHIAICEECDRTKSLETCPVSKTKT